VDIEKYFDTIHHDILINMLKEIVDQATLELIKKLIKAGYVDIFSLNDRTVIPAEGVPQGSILSPLLSNLYLDKLDSYIEKELLLVYNFGEKRAHNEEYIRLKYLTKEEQNFIEKFPELKKAMTRVKHQRMLNEQYKSKDLEDPNFSRIYYVRYADDFLIGYIGSKASARNIYEKVVNFLQEELSLKCNLTKTSIAHASNKIKYLGTMIR
jgi:RNA-directed DNA polymerase